MSLSRVIFLRDKARVGLYVLGLFVFSAGTHAEILDTSLTIGNGWAVVREMRRLDLRAGNQDLYLTDIPSTADLSSLVLRMRRHSLRLLEWERVTDDPRAPASRNLTRDAILHANGFIETPAIRRARPQGAHVAPPQAVWCRLNSPVGGEHVVEISYTMRGVSWSARYQALVRGEPDGPDEHISLELSGSIRIVNTTERAFVNAMIHLAGRDNRVIRDPRKSPGFLALEEGPLADLWLHKNPVGGAEIDQSYRVPFRARIAAHDTTEVHWLRSDRIAASRLYVADHERVPLTMQDIRQSLRTVLIFQNSASIGLGWTLPPGPVEVFHGAVRRRMVHVAYLPHTVINGEIRLEYGLAQEVRASRRSTARTPLQFGTFQETHQVLIENNRPNEIAVEVHVKPDTVLAWDVISSSTPVGRAAGGNMIMTWRVAGRSVESLVYRLRFQQPSL